LCWRSRQVRPWRDDRPGRQPSLPLCQCEHQQWWRLTVAFKDAGLGTGVSGVKVTLTADASAEYQCWNNGGRHPKAGNKETVAGPLVSSGNFPVSQGQVTSSISVGPLSPGSFACPPGQTLYLMSITYSNIVVSDETGNSASATPEHGQLGADHDRCLNAAADRDESSVNSDHRLVER
jgi:hypothetical protein